MQYEMCTAHSVYYICDVYNMCDVFYMCHVYYMCDVNNARDISQLFYVTSLPFFAFYALFAFVLYPNRALIHPPMPPDMDERYVCVYDTHIHTTLTD